MSLTIGIVNYGMGNLHSVYRKLSLLNTTPVIVETPEQVLQADKIILPGVGHFKKAMERLTAPGLKEALDEFVVVKKKPILGICLGMQLMADSSEEGNVPGFGWIKGQVVKFRIQNRLNYKVPQTGWNSVKICKESRLMQNIEDGSEFYFVHSYHYTVADEGDALCKTEFEYEFVSAIERDNIFGVQFHPEKSHRAGQQLLKNFIEI